MNLAKNRFFMKPRLSRLLVWSGKTSSLSETRAEKRPACGLAEEFRARDCFAVRLPKRTCVSWL